MMTTDYPERAARRAEVLYRDEKLSCGEAVFKALLLEAGETCPLGLLRVASAFGHGFGGAGCCCGALAGGEMAIGHFLGREQEKGKNPPDCMKTARRLHDQFVALNHATCCRVLHKGLKHSSPEQIASCTVRSFGGAQLAARVIMEALEARAAQKPAQGA